MTRYFTGKVQIQTGQLIGAGGEGQVFAINGKPAKAAKIYNDTLRATREAKVEAMVRAGLAKGDDLISWPEAVLRDDQGRFCGFQMRKVSGHRPLHLLYGPKSRRQQFPKADYRFVVRAAQNIAKAVASVHGSSVVIGDLNHSGILISANATAALIDADSFQFSDGKTLFPCLVGVEDFLAPELQGRDLSKDPRKVEQDHFALAVAIFQLLFMGRHPYAGIGPHQDLSTGEAIAQNRFAYSQDRARQTASSPPPGSIAFSAFPTDLRAAFERAFGTAPSSRPTAKEWVTLLGNLETNLRACPTSAQHYSPETAGGCIWCGLLAKQGLDMFPRMDAIQTAGPDAFKGVDDAARQITSIRLPSLADLLPTTSMAAASWRRLAWLLIRQTGRTRPVAMALGISALVTAFSVFVYAEKTPFALLFLIAYGIGQIVKAYNTPKNIKLIAATFAAIDADIQTALNESLERSGLTGLLKQHRKLTRDCAHYFRSGTNLAEGLAGLQSNERAQQLDEWLNRIMLRQANIPGIGAARIGKLLSFGIETAADLTEAAIARVPGFGPTTIRKLLDWRKEQERGFVFTARPTAEKQALAQQSASRKLDLANQILEAARNRNGFLQRVRAAQSEVQADTRLIAALSTRAQLDSLVKALGRPVRKSTVQLKID